MENIMIKSSKKLLLLVTLFTAYNAQATILRPISPLKNPIIIFDVGNVLLKQNQFKNSPDYIHVLARALIESSSKMDTLKATLWCLLHFSELRTINSQGPEDEVINFVALNHPVLNTLTKDGITIADRAKDILCQGNAIKETQKVMSDLINNEYIVALGTNKGSKTIERLITSGTLAQLPYSFIFSCDSHVKGKNDPFYKKPSSTYFEKLKEKLSDKGFENNPVIFIDDKIENVLAAARAGMFGIHYTSPKQLIIDLQQVGITI